MFFGAFRRLLPPFAMLPALLLGLALPVVADDHVLEAEAPRVLAALEQGMAAELGTGLGRNPELANAYFALAARLGHRAAMDAFDQSVDSEPLDESCGNFANGFEHQRFDLNAYLSGLSPVRRRIADLIRRHAARNGIDERVALAVAMAESNLNAGAVSPMNAQGVMQLIPATQQRFGVKDAFDAESNVRGGMAYLKWLKLRFNGDWGLVAAAYNAGEGAVDRYRGIPPYRETQDYVRRVLFFAGLARQSRI
jgi:soluble lytic murein transglycosylase-like protein